MITKNYSTKTVAGGLLLLLPVLGASALFGASWQQVPGSWVSVAAQSDGTALATDRLGSVYKIDASTSTLVSDAGRKIGVTTMSGSAPPYQIAGKNSSMFLVNQATPSGSGVNGAIYQVDASTGTPTRMPGAGSLVQMGPDGTPYALSNGSLYRSCVCGVAGGPAPAFKWIEMSAFGPAGDPLKSVSVGASIWGVTTNSNDIVRWNTTTLAWEIIPKPGSGATALDVSVAEDGTVLALMSSGLFRWAGSSWSRDVSAGTSPAITKVSLSKAGLHWGLSSMFQLYVYR